MKPRFGRNRDGVAEIRNDRGETIGRIAYDPFINGERNGATPWVVYAGANAATAADVGRFTYRADARAFAENYFTTEDA